MKFYDENGGNGHKDKTRLSLNNLSIHRIYEYEDEDDEKAYGVYLDDNLLGVFWNEELAILFKEAAEQVPIIVKD